VNQYILKSFHALEDKQPFWNFCQLASLDTVRPAHTNMWGNDKNALPYILTETNRFDGVNGEFTILYHNDVIVACAGVYISEFSASVSLAGTRLWIDADYRNQMLAREHILPAHKAWSKKQGIKQIAICFNDYNKNLMRTFFRSRLGESSQRTLVRQQHHLFYSNINELSFTVTIQDTPQWVLYESLDPNWSFDWSKIKFC
jgi:N-acetylglutamate synthase-like GNAT family acetyltransferase